MSFSKYEEYKDSGIEWLGSVPEHWGIVSLKWLSPVQRGASPRPIDDPKYFDDDGEYAWVRIADVSSSSNGRLYETTQRLSELGSSLSVKIPPGEIFISIAGTVGKPCISEINACIHDGFVYFPHIKINRMFLFRIFEAGLCYGGLGKWGTQLNLNTDTVGAIRIPIPPNNELEQIVSFLDAETAKIDALVAEQRRLIELLKEKRQAVISHAVTKGLNPDAPLKDSGIEWLGEVPEHWEVIRMGVLYADVAENGNEDLPVLQVSIHHGVSDRELNESEADRKITRIEDKSKYRRVQPNDLVYNMMRAWQGGFGTVKVEGMVSPAYVVARPKLDFHTQFIEHLLRTPQAIEQMRRYSHGVTDFRLRLYWDKFKNVRVALPDQAEQEKICDYIEKTTKRFDELSSEAERAIELLQERRTALISAAVTGKIDVREYAKQETA